MIFLKIVEEFYADSVVKNVGKTVKTIQEDPVDVYLRKQSGKITRGKDPQYCRHSSSGMCSYCQPLEPFDATYQKENKIKHLSFHAYLRQRSEASAHDIGPLIEEGDFEVKRTCSSHPPYPEGICTKCQPTAIILNQQPFRMVDHVEFESPKIVEYFLSKWRSTGFQRFGWLLGKYAVYEGVPLGIKSVVSVIYEPPQDGSVDGFQLLEDSNEADVLSVASQFGLSVVGMVYTDLTDDGTKTGKVERKRSSESYFISSIEALFMAQQQLAHPSPCKDSNSGKFSSKFVTVIISGTVPYFSLNLFV